MYNATTLKSVGQCVVQLVNPETRKKCKVKFTVINNDSCTNLLGSKAAQQMGFVDVNYSIMKRTVHVNTVLTAPDEMGVTMKQITSEYKGAFEGLGQLGPMLHLEVDETIKPTQLPSQRIPESIKVPLKARFLCLVSFQAELMTLGQKKTLRFGTVRLEWKTGLRIIWQSWKKRESSKRCRSPQTGLALSWSQEKVMETFDYVSIHDHSIRH